MNRNIIPVLFIIVVFSSSCSKPEPTDNDGSFREFISVSSAAAEIYDEITNGRISPDFLIRFNSEFEDSGNNIFMSMYYAALSAISNDDYSIIENSFKSLTFLRKGSNGSDIFHPDPLLYIMGKNFSEGISFYYNNLSKEVYDTIPEYSMILSKRAAILHNREHFYPWVAFSYFNMATLYEHFNDLDNAISMTDSAIEIWETAGDTLQLANLYKYKGILLGKTRKFDEGKEMINEAYNIYLRLKYEPGKFVSLHDLGELYFIEEKYDSSLFCFFSEKEYWRQANDSQRCFIANISLIKTHDKFNDRNNVMKLIEENESIIASPVISEVSRREYFIIKSEIIYKYENIEKRSKDIVSMVSLKTMLALVMFRQSDSSYKEG